MSAEPTRARSWTASAAMRPPGPEVGEIVDGVLPGAGGDLEYRLYRPATPGPHPIVVYFHGGGWVLGSHDSDDPFCRDLCVRSDAIVVSVDYRHAPEASLPRGGRRRVRRRALDRRPRRSSSAAIPGQLAVAGWSAGGNIADVVCQLARDAGGPEIVGQLLVTPVTDCDMTRASYGENAEGYILTKALMEWFWDHYSTRPIAPTRGVAAAGRGPLGPPAGGGRHVRVRPAARRGRGLRRGARQAGVPTQHVFARGHTHTSLTMVDVVLSARRCGPRWATRCAASSRPRFLPEIPDSSASSKSTNAARLARRHRSRRRDRCRLRRRPPGSELVVDASARRHRLARDFAEQREPSTPVLSGFVTPPRARRPGTVRRGAGPHRRGPRTWCRC